MTVKKEVKSRILKAVGETTADLRRLDFIDKKAQQGIKELVLKPIPPTSKTEPNVFEDWTVLYDAEHAPQLSAHIRMREGTDEETVREWFSRTFQPLTILELRKNSELKENPLAAALGAGLRGGVSALGRGAVAVGGAALRGAAAGADKILGNPLAAKALVDLIKTQQAKDKVPGATPAAQSVGSKPKPPPGVIRIAPTNVPGSGVAISPTGEITPFKKLEFTKEQQDREIRADGDSVDSVMKSIHMALDGDYSYDRQIKTIKDMARRKDLPYEALLGSWIKDPDGFNKAIDAAQATSVDKSK